MTRSQDFSVRGKYIDPRFQFDSDSNKGVSGWLDHQKSAHSNAMKIKLESGSGGHFHGQTNPNMCPSNFFSWLRLLKPNLFSNLLEGDCNWDQVEIIWWALRTLHQQQLWFHFLITSAFEVYSNEYQSLPLILKLKNRFTDSLNLDSKYYRFDWRWDREYEDLIGGWCVGWQSYRFDFFQNLTLSNVCSFWRDLTVATWACFWQNQFFPKGCFLQKHHFQLTPNDFHED